MFVLLHDGIRYGVGRWVHMTVSRRHWTYLHQVLTALWWRYVYLCETRRSLWVIYSFCFPVCQHDFAQSCDWIFTQNSWERFQQRLKTQHWRCEQHVRFWRWSQN